MQVSDIKVGTVGKKNWAYKNAAPFSYRFNSTTWPAWLYGVAVLPESIYDGDYRQYLLSVLDDYFYRDLTTIDLKETYPRFTLGTYKFAGYTEVADGKHDVYLRCFDGTEIRPLLYSDVDIVNNTAQMLATVFASYSGIGSLTNFDGGNLFGSYDEAIVIRLAEDLASSEETKFFNTIPIFDNESNLNQYLQSDDPDPTHFGGYLSMGDYNYGGGDVDPENPNTNEDILGIAEDLGFSLADGPMRGAVVDDANLKLLATKIGKGWFSGNISEAIIGMKLIRTPGAILTKQRQEIIPGTTIDPNPVMGYPIENQFQEFSFGTYRVSEEFNSFLDYTNTSVSLYLPYSGLHQLDSKTVIGSEISLTCLIDFITGSLIWYVQVNRNAVRQVIYEFTGNCSMELVLSSIDYAQKITQALTGIIGLTSSVGISKKGKIEVDAKEAVSGALNLAESTADSYVRVGNVSSNFGWTGIQYPFLIFSRSKVEYPSNYREMYGMPSMKKERLGNLTGYTQVGEIHLDGLTCLEEERQELETLLKNGVIL